MRTSQLQPESESRTRVTVRSTRRSTALCWLALRCSTFACEADEFGTKPRPPTPNGGLVATPHRFRFSPLTLVAFRFPQPSIQSTTASHRISFQAKVALVSTSHSLTCHHVPSSRTIASHESVCPSLRDPDPDPRPTAERICCLLRFPMRGIHLRVSHTITTRDTRFGSPSWEPFFGVCNKLRRPRPLADRLGEGGGSMQLADICGQC